MIESCKVHAALHRLQGLCGVNNAALLKLVVRHILKDRSDVRQKEKMENSQVPEEDGHK